MKRKHIEMNLGHVCNNNCSFCMSYFENKEGKFIPFESVKEQIDLYANKGYNSIGFVGGEPTIYPYISQIVAFAKEKGFLDINITTNGRRLSDKELLISLIDAGLNKINFSLHGYTSAEDDLTNVKGGFDQKEIALDNISELIKSKKFSKDSFFIVSVLNIKNHDDMHNLIKKYSKKGFFNFRINFVRPSPKPVLEHLVPSYTEVKDSIKKAIDQAKKSSVNLSFEGIPCCMFDDYFDSKFIGDNVDYIDDISFFQDDSIGLGSWKDQRLDLSVKLEICKGCKYNNICPGIWKYYLLIYGAEEFKNEGK